MRDLGSGQRIEILTTADSVRLLSSSLALFLLFEAAGVSWGNMCMGTETIKVSW